MDQLKYQQHLTQKLNLDPRESAAKRGYNAKWQKARIAYLQKNPLCVDCQAEGRIVSARIVDHIIPHKGDEKLFWDQDNWQSLCQSHHSKKTARSDGGFGNRRKTVKSTHTIKKEPERNPWKLT